MKILITAGVACLIIIAGCKKKPEWTDHNFVVNKTHGTHSLTLDGEAIALPDSILAKELEEGPHKVSVDGTDFEFTIGRGKRLFVNPTLDTIIREETFYSMNTGGLRTAKQDDFSTPFDVVHVGGFMYYGPYEMITNDLFIEGWHFHVGNDNPGMISSEDPVFESLVDGSYFKLYSTREFMETHSPMNYSGEWIGPFLKQHTKNAATGYSLEVEESGFFFVKSESKNVEGIVGRLMTNSLGELEFRDVYMLDPINDGKVVGRIAVLTDVVFTDGGMRQKKDVEIVLTDAMNKPKIRTLK
ncbi:MAG TPA: hypothetical protein VFE50_16540 [Cyclobacteriaceae bacterium]|nr:hypothetical protein [Cyclobacteriaceae bacterium]